MRNWQLRTRHWLLMLWSLFSCWINVLMWCLPKVHCTVLFLIIPANLPRGQKVDISGFSGQLWDVNVCNVNWNKTFIFAKPFFWLRDSSTSTKERPCLRARESVCVLEMGTNITVASAFHSLEARGGWTPANVLSNLSSKFNFTCWHDWY